MSEHQGMQNSLTPEQQERLSKLCEGLRNAYGPEYLSSLSGLQQASVSTRAAYQHGLSNVLADPVMRALYPGLAQSNPAGPQHFSHLHKLSLEAAMSANPLHIPRTRWTDEGEWTAMPHITLVVAIVGTAVSILMGWAAWELGRWVVRTLLP